MTAACSRIPASSDFRASYRQWNHAFCRLPIGREPSWLLFNRVLAKIVREPVCETYFGARIKCEIRDFIGRYLYNFGIWEPHISAFLQSRLSPGDVFCDVGANIGYETLLASRLVGPGGTVVSIEASPSITKKLHANLALNHTSNVRVVNAAVSDRRGMLTLYEARDGNSGTGTTLASRGLTKECDVAALPLTEILSKRERECLRLVKIDVEGGELPILCNLLDSIDEFPETMEIVVEMSPDAPAVLGVNSQGIVERFLKRDFRPFVLPNSYRPSAYLDFAGPQPPLPLIGPLSEQQDILFSRQYGVG
jgi:FkbM family methyltransferase